MENTLNAETPSKIGVEPLKLDDKQSDIIDEPSEVVAEPSPRHAMMFKLFDRKKHAVWIKLMGHEDSLSRKIMVCIIY